MHRVRVREATDTPSTRHFALPDRERNTARRSRNRKELTAETLRTPRFLKESLGVLCASAVSSLPCMGSRIDFNNGTVYKARHDAHEHTTFVRTGSDFRFAPKL